MMYLLCVKWWNMSGVGASGRPPHAEGQTGRHKVCPYEGQTGRHKGCPYEGQGPGGYRPPLQGQGKAIQP